MAALGEVDHLGLGAWTPHHYGDTVKTAGILETMGLSNVDRLHPASVYAVIHRFAEIFTPGDPRTLVNMEDLYAYAMRMPTDEETRHQVWHAFQLWHSFADRLEENFRSGGVSKDHLRSMTKEEIGALLYGSGPYAARPRVDKAFCQLVYLLVRCRPVTGGLLRCASSGCERVAAEDTVRFGGRCCLCCYKVDKGVGVNFRHGHVCKGTDEVAVGYPCAWATEPTDTRARQPDERWWLTDPDLSESGKAAMRWTENLPQYDQNSIATWLVPRNAEEGEQRARTLNFLGGKFAAAPPRPPRAADYMDDTQIAEALPGYSTAEGTVSTTAAGGNEAGVVD